MATFEKLYIKFEKGNRDSLDKAIKEAERLGYKQNAIELEGNGTLSLSVYGDYFTSVYGDSDLISLGYKEHKIKEDYPDWVKNLTEVGNGWCGVNSVAIPGGKYTGTPLQEYQKEKLEVKFLEDINEVPDECCDCAEDSGQYEKQPSKYNPYLYLFQSS